VPVSFVLPILDWTAEHILAKADGLVPSLRKASIGLASGNILQALATQTFNGKAKRVQMESCNML